MADIDGIAELELAQAQREQDGGERDPRQHPEGVHVGQERGLRLLPDPLDCLLLRLEQRVALGHEAIVRWGRVLLRAIVQSPARNRTILCCSICFRGKGRQDIYTTLYRLFT
jgi:hypothetical protein